MSNSVFINQFKTFIHLKAKQVGYEPLVQAAYDAWIESEASSNTKPVEVVRVETRAPIRPMAVKFTDGEIASLRRYRERKLDVGTRRNDEDRRKYLAALSVINRTYHIKDIMRRFNLSLGAAHGLISRAPNLGFSVEMRGQQGNRNTKYRVRFK